MPEVCRHFWGWDRPVLDNAVRFFKASYDGQRALDLSGQLILVPTTEAGRRLKEALARSCPAGVLAPWVRTAEQVLLPHDAKGRAALATRLQTLAAWQQVLAKAEVGQMSALFPLPPEDRGWTWQTELAQMLSDLSMLLGAAGLGFTDVEEHAVHDRGRWRELAILEKRFHAELARVGLVDAQRLKRQGAHQPDLPLGIREVVVVAAPDLPPLFQIWALQCPVPVTVAIQAPPERAGEFDAIGRPLPSSWGEDAPVVVPLGAEGLHLRHDAAAQSLLAVDLLRGLAPLGRVAVGVGDPEVGAVLHERLLLEGVRVFEPGGKAAQECGLWHILAQYRSLLSGLGWRPFASLLRVPEVRKMWLGASAGKGLTLLTEADAFAMEHMPVTLKHALELCDNSPLLRMALLAAQEQAQRLASLPLDQAARQLLTDLYGLRKFHPNAPEDDAVTGLADAWLEVCREIREECARFGLEPAPEEALGMSLEQLSQVRLSPPRGEIDLVLQGWLELLWEPAPNLVVAGVNEEYVPGILIAHPFLPDRLRQELGLPCQQTRFARDAYTLSALAAQRQSKGTLHVLCGQWSERGDALRPSRLLFLCPDDELPARTRLLFPTEDSAREEAAEPVRTVAWRLVPQVPLQAVESISPSRIRSYLTCPFRDGLRHGLRMESVDATKRELSPGEFGTLVHHAFQRLAEEPGLRHSTSAKEIAAFLVETAVARAAEIHGRRPAPLVQLQLESLKQRLRHAADTEAAEREKGWFIYATEWTPDESNPLRIEGARLSCKVDRIDRHEGSGHLRVLDYKTADRVTEPRAFHTRALHRRSQVAESDGWKCFELKDGSRHRWLDVQLPLYAAVLRAAGLNPDQVGYFTLPKSVQETRVLIWEDFDEGWVEAALACAGEVVKRIREGEFWPPSEKARDEELDLLFLHDPALTVQWDGPLSTGQS